MKNRIILLIIICLFISFVFADDSILPPSEVREAIQKEMYLINDLMNVNYEQLFEPGEKIEECHLSEGQIIYPIDLSKVLSEENNLNEIVLDDGKTHYLFAMMLNDRGKLIVSATKKSSDIYIGAGGFGKGYIQAETLMSKLVSEQRPYPVYQVNIGQYIMVWDNRVIPFDEGVQGISEEFLNVNEFKQLPTVDEYLQLLKDVVSKEIQDLEDFRQETGYDGNIYGNPFHVDIHPHMQSNELWWLVILIVSLFVSGVLCQNALSRKKHKY